MSRLNELVGELVALAPQWEVDADPIVSERISELATAIVNLMPDPEPDP